MSPRKNTYRKQASVLASAEDRWIPANTAKAKSFLPKLELLSLNASAEQKSILSHWAQTLGKPFAKPFESAALEILERGKATDESVSEAPSQILFPELFDVPFPPPKKPKFTFIDLFAGIGGFRIAMQNLGGKCVFSNHSRDDILKSPPKKTDKDVSPIKCNIYRLISFLRNKLPHFIY